MSDKQRNNFKDALNLMADTPPEKMGNFFAWWQEQVNTAKARTNSAVVLLPLAGRLWGCELHESPGVMCTKGGTCLIERLISCPEYQANPDKALLKLLIGESAVFSCVYCGSELDKEGNPGELSTILCPDCKDGVLDSFQRSFQAGARSQTQEQRQQYLK